ncbi:Major facilitator superfamily [Trinorchestia longiramus]|nr:Major facilitator superfamily [Trinorchestia longiramus]
MSLVCYSLYFTDFVGEAVFGGDPGAPEGSPSQLQYEAGVRFGCWGMALYSLSCSCYSFVIEKLVKRFGARKVYVCGQLVYSLGMLVLALVPTPTAVILLSCTAGVMYSTLFTMPYLLVAHYHATQTVGFERSQTVEKSSLNLQQASGLVDKDGSSQQIRGLGTDVAIVSSMVFLAQFIQALCMGTFMSAYGSTVAVVIAASVFSFCGSICATQVEYLDL